MSEITIARCLKTFDFQKVARANDGAICVLKFVLEESYG